MYAITIMLSEDRKKRKIQHEKTIEGENRKELEAQIPSVIEELAKSDDYVSPTAEYIIERNGLYLDGEVDVRVRITRNGVSVKCGELTI